MTRCVVILGGSFDPVHNGHVALGVYFAKLLQPDEFRVIPTGNPWQKETLKASSGQRIEMVQRAFEAQQLPITIDRQEINRKGPTYTVETLRQLRTELGSQTSIVFLLGADQLQCLDSWKDWQELFNYAHICGAARPGYSLDVTALPEAVSREFSERAGTIEQIRMTSHGMSFLTRDLAIDASATDIRAALKRGDKPTALVPSVVLDYIEQFHLYKD